MYFIHYITSIYKKIQHMINNNNNLLKNNMFPMYHILNNIIRKYHFFTFVFDFIISVLYLLSIIYKNINM